jgi:hypothetical protein
VQRSCRARGGDSRREEERRRERSRCLGDPTAELRARNLSATEGEGDGTERNPEGSRREMVGEISGERHRRGSADLRRRWKSLSLLRRKWDKVPVRWLWVARGLVDAP